MPVVNLLQYRRHAWAEQSKSLIPTQQIKLRAKADNVVDRSAIVKTCLNYVPLRFPNQ